MDIKVLVPAAGMGRRMGASINKQYLQLGGRPILARTLELFEHHPAISQIYPIIPDSEIDFFKTRILPVSALHKLATVVAGGRERQDSVRNGLLLLEQKHTSPDTLVLIHDGVRPLFNPELLTELIEVACREGAAVVGVPVKDTIKEVANKQIVATPERTHLWQAQTPQIFRFELILQAYQQAEQDGFYGTDDASLVERLGARVEMIEGDYRNIKITTPEDLLIAEALLTNKGEH